MRHGNVSQKKGLELLDKANSLKRLFLEVPCKKELIQTDGEGENKKISVVLQSGKTYSIYDSGLDIGNATRYWAITNSTKTTTIPGSLFFERFEVEEYFDLSKITEAGHTLEEAPRLHGVTFDTSKLEDMKEE